MDQNLGFTTSSIKLYYVFKIASNDQIVSIFVIASLPGRKFLEKYYIKSFIPNFFE